MGISNRGPSGIPGLMATTALSLPMAMPEIILSNGVWQHPDPGRPVKILVFAIGGGGGGGGTNSIDGGSGGGGGSGRIVILTLTVTTNIDVIIGAAGSAGSTDQNGALGGTTTFGTLISAGGGNGGGTPTTNNRSGSGGAGGFGGGGGGASAGTTQFGGHGGDGLDFIGGGGGNNRDGGGNPGQSAYGGLRAYFGAASQSDRMPGWPNGGLGGSITTGGLGGDPLILFPFTLGFGAGGRGAGYAANPPGSGGKQGAVFVWILRN